jgi:hypothetical protein
VSLGTRLGRTISAYEKALVTVVGFVKYSSSAMLDKSIERKLSLLADIHEFSPLEKPSL